MTVRSSSARRKLRTAKLDLRLTPRDKEILRQAAKADRRSVSDFVLHSALSRAEEFLADRRHFRLDAKQWQEFLKALDAPPREHPRLKRLLQEPSVFDKSEP